MDRNLEHKWKSRWLFAWNDYYLDNIAIRYYDKKFGMSWVCKCYSKYRNDLLLVKIAVNVVISIQWIVDYVAGVATFNLIARILGAVFMPLPLQRPAFLSLISTFIYLLIKLGAVIALVKVSIFLFLTRKSFSIWINELHTHFGRFM